MPETFVGRFPKIVKRVVTWFSFGSLHVCTLRADLHLLKGALSNKPNRLTNPKSNPNLLPEMLMFLSKTFPHTRI